MKNKLFFIFSFLFLIVYLFNIKSNIDNFTNLQKMPKNVYVNGVGGLGNCLFQIATAVYYKEKYNMNILLKTDSDFLLYGTSNKFNRNKMRKKNKIELTYKDTIYKKFNFYKNIKNNYQIIRNDYTDDKVIPKSDLLIDGYCQNLNLFDEYLYKIPKYLNLEDNYVNNLLKTKYKNINNGIMIGIRVGNDFHHMKKINRNSYLNALDELKKRNINTDNLYIISDVKNAWKNVFNLQDKYPAIEVNEDDILNYVLE